MDPETLQRMIFDIVGREVSIEEAKRIGQTAGRMLETSAPVLTGHGGGVPQEDFDAVLRELANPDD